MTPAEFDAELGELRALAERQRRTAIEARDGLGALRAQLAILIAEELLAGRIGQAEAMLDVGQLVEQVQGGREGLLQSADCSVCSPG